MALVPNCFDVGKAKYQSSAALLLLPNGAAVQAARRRAITELLFFASVGDIRRCQRIVRIWNLQVGGWRFNPIACNAPPVCTGLGAAVHCRLAP